MKKRRLSKKLAKAAEKGILSVEEVSDWLGVAPRTVYRLAKKGLLPSFKVGGQWRFSAEMLKDWVVDQVTIERLKSGLQTLQKK